MCFPSANGLRKVIGTEPSLWALPKPLHSPGGKRKWQAREGNHTNLSPRQMKKLVNSLSNTQGVDLRFLSPLCLLWYLPPASPHFHGNDKESFQTWGKDLWTFFCAQHLLPSTDITVNCGSCTKFCVPVDGCRLSVLLTLFHQKHLLLQS